MAKFYRLKVTRQLKVYGGPKGGADYTFENACPRCGTGARRVAPFRFHLKKQLDVGMFCTLDGEVFLSNSVAESLRGLRGSFLRETIDRQTGKPLPFVELIPELVLPPFSSKTRGYEKECQCKDCKRDGYFEIPHVPLELVYRRVPEALQERNVLCTYEHFGNSRLRTPFEESVLAPPLLIISGAVAEKLRLTGMQGFVLEPVDGLA